MIWFIIYIIGSILAVLAAAKRIRRVSLGEPDNDSPGGHSIVYPVAFLFSWIFVLVLAFIITDER